MVTLNEPGYNWYVVETFPTGKMVINEGFDYQQDALDRIREQKAEGHVTTQTFKVYTRRFLISKNVDPNNSSNWGNPSYIKPTI